MEIEYQKSKGTYIFDCIWYLFLSMFYYRRNLFRALTGLTFAVSRNILWALALGFLVVGYLVTKRERM